MARARVVPSASGDAGDGEDGTNGRDGIRGADDDRVGGAERLEHAGCGTRRVGAGIPDLADLGLRLVAHEVLLEVEPAVGAEDARPDRLVRHR